MKTCALIIVSAIAAVSAVPINPVNVFDLFQPIPSLNMYPDRSYERYPFDYYTPSYYHRYSLPYSSPYSYEYKQSNYQPIRPISYQEFYQKPIFVITPSAQEENSFSVFYLHKGLQSLYRMESLSWLQKYLAMPGLKGLAFFPHTFLNSQFFDTPISEFVADKSFKTGDFLSNFATRQDTPMLFIAPGVHFDNMNFYNIEKVSDFRIHNEIIDIVPVVTYPSSQAQLQQVFWQQHGGQIHGQSSKIPQPSHAHPHSEKENLDSNNERMEKQIWIEMPMPIGKALKNEGINGQLEVQRNVNVEASQQGLTGLNPVPAIQAPVQSEAIDTSSSASSNVQLGRVESTVVDSIKPVGATVAAPEKEQVVLTQAEMQ